MICLDQPNRRMRTRMSGGVGGGLRKGAPYPDMYYSGETEQAKYCKPAIVYLGLHP